jgi:DNA processing protein
MNDSSTYYRIALNQVHGLGNVTQRRMIQYFGSAQAVFEASTTTLARDFKIPKRIYEQLKSKEVLKAAEDEMRFIEKEKIDLLWFTDSDYPERLRQVYDAPVLMYQKGNYNLNTSKIIAVVGTRSCTRYGMDKTNEFIDGIAPHNPLIISGLAYGIDITAHRRAMKNNLSTVGVLGHGLNKIYPASHRKDATLMCENGGLLTEYSSNTKLSPELFPMRNRIVAGLADALIVIEAAEKGGALITAEFAFGYNRDVFALPGRVGDTYSTGCNNLIKQQKAHLLQSAKDIEYIMRWEKNEAINTVQKQLFIELTEEEQQLYDYLQGQGTVGMEALMIDLNLPGSVLASRLLQLELKGVVRAFPGKKYSAT